MYIYIYNPIWFSVIFCPFSMDFPPKKGTSSPLRPKSRSQDSSQADEGDEFPEKRLVYHWKIMDNLRKIMENPINGSIYGETSIKLVWWSMKYRDYMGLSWGQYDELLTINGGFHKWGYPIMDGLQGKISLTWMMNRGAPISGNLHMVIYGDFWL